MQMVEGTFGSEEVTSFAVNVGESEATVMDYMGDTGINAAIMLDYILPTSGCYKVPGELGLYEHFRTRVGEPDKDPPFPLHVVIDAEGRLAYLKRDHDPATLAAVLSSLVP